MRYAVISGGIVVNTIEWDGKEMIKGLEGADFIRSDTAEIGDSYAAGAFVKPPSDDDGTDKSYL
nr:MAG TPA: hypothetical protein [Caudoviricetes sp.]